MARAQSGNNSPSTSCGLLLINRQSINYSVIDALLQPYLKSDPLLMLKT